MAETLVYRKKYSHEKNENISIETNHSLTAESGATVLLASFPRSGNTFFRIVARLCFSLDSSEGYPPPVDLTNMKVGEKKIMEMLGSLPSDEMVQPPVFLKTHDLPRPDDERPVVHLVRDGRDAYVSLTHYMLEFQREAWRGMGFLEVMRVLVEHPGYFGGWSQSIAAWSSHTAPVTMVRFEDLIADPLMVAAGACRQIGLEVPQAAAHSPTFAELSAEWPGMFRKGKVGAWRDEMTVEIEELFWAHHGKMMERLGYAR